MSARPSVDVIVPFAGSDDELRGTLARLGSLDLREGDSLTVVDNRPAAGGATVSFAPAASAYHGTVDPVVVRAPERQSSYFARNRGAALGTAEWLLFIDADVDPPHDLLGRYFRDGSPPGDVAVVAGAIRDQGSRHGERQPAAARYAFLRNSMAHESTAALLGPFAKTANAMVRRAPFHSVGGFRDDVRSGGDVDLCYRLVSTGWRLEFREHAAVEHVGRGRVADLLRQQARHGAGTAWLDREYPGFSPGFRWSSLAVSLARGVVKSGWARLLRDRDRSILELLDPLTALAFHLGRLRSNRVA